MGSIVKKCECKSEFQDKIYGKDMRLHNLSKNEKSCKCTVCRKSKNV